MKTVFKIDGIDFPHIRVMSLKQAFQILDGVNSGRVLTGEMKRDIIGTYYNYTMVLKPEYSKDGMAEYSNLLNMLSSPVESHELTVPFDIGGGVKTELTFRAYITSGEREMLKYDRDNVDYWKEGTFQFVAMVPQRTFGG